MGSNLRPEPTITASGRTAEILERLDHFASRCFDAVWSWGAWLVAIGLSPGLALWPRFHSEHLDFVLKNNLEQELRLEVLRWMGFSLVLVTAGYMVSWGIRRARGGKVSFESHARAIHRYAFLSVLLPFLTGLRHKGIEVKHNFVTLLMIAAIAAGIGVVLYRVAPRVRVWLDRVPRQDLVNTWLPRIGVVALCAWYGTRLSGLALIDHQNLGTHIWDLGIYDSLLWKTSHGEFLACTFCKGGTHTSGHFDPVLGLLVPLYEMSPRAETLLVFQSWWLSLGVFPLYLLASRRLGNEWFGVMLAAIYVMYPALHGVNMFDFHSLTLSIPTFLWLIYFLDRGSNLGYWFCFGLLLATREDMALLTSFVGIYAISQRRTALGLTTIVIAIAYLYYVKTNVMPEASLLMQSKKTTSSFIYYYQEMIPYPEEGLRGLIVSFFTNPLYVLQVLTKPAKLFYFLALLMPLLFLPLFAGAKRIIMVYGFIFVGMASRKYVYSLHFQYSTILFPILIASVPDAVARLRDSKYLARFNLRGRRLAYTLMITAVVATALTSMKFGTLAENKSFRAGWNRFAWKTNKKRANRYKVLERLVAQIPADASVCTTNELGPHVSARDSAAMWPRCKNMHFLFLHTKRFKKKQKKRLERMVMRGQYRLVDRGAGLSLYEVVPKEERAEARKLARQEQRLRQEKKQEKRERDKKKQDKKKGGPGKAATKPTEDVDRPDDAMDEAERFRSQVMGREPDAEDEEGTSGDRTDTTVLVPPAG